MKDNFWIGVIIGAVIVGVFFALPAGLNAAMRGDAVAGLRGEAVKRNHAEWIVDPESGTTTFAWKPLPGDPITPLEIERRNK